MGKRNDAVQNWKKHISAENGINLIRMKWSHSWFLRYQILLLSFLYELLHFSPLPLLLYFCFSSNIWGKIFLSWGTVVYWNSRTTKLILYASSFNFFGRCNFPSLRSTCLNIWITMSTKKIYVFILFMLWPGKWFFPVFGILNLFLTFRTFGRKDFDINFKTLEKDRTKTFLRSNK